MSTTRHRPLLLFSRRFSENIGRHAARFAYLMILRCRSVLPQNVPLCYRNLKKCAGMLFKSQVCTDMPTKNISDTYRRMPVPLFFSCVSFIPYPLKICAGMMPKSQEHTDICPLFLSFFSCEMDSSVPFEELWRYDAQTPQTC